MLIAHRGIFNNKNIPENSLLSFQRAIDEGFSFELDVQLTKDNVLVVFHDDNLKRMTGVNQLLEDTTYLELQNFFLLSTKEKIPTFHEVLEITKGKVFLDIEIKPTKRIHEIDKILSEELNSVSSFTIKSFQPSIVRFLKKNHPNWKVGYLVHSHYNSFIYQLLLPSKLMIVYSKADFLSIHKELQKKKKFIKLRKHYPLTIWTIQSLDEIHLEGTYICNHLPYSNNKNVS